MVKKMAKRDGYMVLSIGDIRNILKCATDKSKVCYGRTVLQSTFVINLKFSDDKFNSDKDNARQVNLIK